jgi:protein-disulfide isomerase
VGLVVLSLLSTSALAATQWNFPTPLRGYEVIFLVPDGDGFMQEKLSRNEYPVLGAPTAEFVAVYLYDYTCPHCRKMHAHMEQALARYGEKQLAVMLVPAPLNTDCNPHVAETEEGKQDACKLARLALQVWVADREKFAAFDGWLFEPSEPRTAEEARAQAQQLVGAAALNAAGAQAEQMLQSGVALYGRAGGGQLPKLFLRQEIVVGVPETAAKLFEMLEDKLGLQAR